MNVDCFDWKNRAFSGIVFADASIIAAFGHVDIPGQPSVMEAHHILEY